MHKPSLCEDNKCNIMRRVSKFDSDTIAMATPAVQYHLVEHLWKSGQTTCKHNLFSKGLTIRSFRNSFTDKKNYFADSVLILIIKK